MDHRNDELLRLSECIESLKSEVKQKMTCGTARSGGTKVTGRRFSEKSFFASHHVVANATFLARENAAAN